MSTGEAHCDRCRAVHDQGKSRWKCDGCGGTFCAADLVNGKRWNYRGPLHVGMTRSGSFRVCGSMVALAAPAEAVAEPAAEA